MSQMLDQETQPSSFDDEEAIARLDRSLAHLRAAEAGLRNWNRESITFLGEPVAEAAEELRALDGALRSGGPRRLTRGRLQARIMELKQLSRRVQALFGAARSFHAALLRIHQTELHGYGGVVDIPGARNLTTFPHRLEMRG
jgi:hypothetical protein